MNKKKIIILGIIGVVVVGFIAIPALVGNNEANKRAAEEQARVEAAIQATEDATNSAEMDYDAMIQQSLVEEYGEPPEGFRWTMTGELEAISSDNISAENLVHTYIRSVSILDFATAQKYAKTSKIYNTYMDYYDEVSTAVIDYYNQFLRKQYTFALESIENLGVEGVATTADGTQVISVKLKVLDLTDKDFWRDDMLEIYQTMRLYSDTEDDDTKKEQYLYDYIYSKYEDGTIGKREVICDFKVGKLNGSGWLLADDAELNAYLTYDQGTDVARYILDTYNDWLIETTIEEQEAYLSQTLEDINKEIKQSNEGVSE